MLLIGEVRDPEIAAGVDGDGEGLEGGGGRGPAGGGGEVRPGWGEPAPASSVTELPRKLATQTVPAASTAMPWGWRRPPPV